MPFFMVTKVITWYNFNIKNQRVVKMEKITVIVPCYNEQESLPLFYKEIIRVAKQLKE